MPEREFAIFHKNLGWAYLGKIGREACPVLSEQVLTESRQQATVKTALDKLQIAEPILKELRADGENVHIYLADTYRLQGCGYDALGQHERARQKWADALGHALAVRDSDYCQTDSPLRFECSDAKRWSTDLQDVLGE